jgi:hypothetical protein
MGVLNLHLEPASNCGPRRHLRSAPAYAHASPVAWKGKPFCAANMRHACRISLFTWARGKPFARRSCCGIPAPPEGQRSYCQRRSALRLWRRTRRECAGTPPMAVPQTFATQHLAFPPSSRRFENGKSVRPRARNRECPTRLRNRSRFMGTERHRRGGLPMLHACARIA